jgi:hypothetical protein
VPLLQDSQRAGTTPSNRQASVINRTASGNSKKSAVTVAQPTSARLLVIQSNQASQISSTPGGERGQHDHLATENAKHGGRHNKQQKQNADKVVSTLVIVDGPFSVSGPRRFDACDRKRKQSVTHSPSRSLDLNYQMRKM